MEQEKFSTAVQLQKDIKELSRKRSIILNTSSINFHYHVGMVDVTFDRKVDNVLDKYIFDQIRNILSFIDTEISKLKNEFENL